MNRILKIVKIIFTILVILIAIYTGIIIVQKVIWRDKTPSVFGIKNFIVLSGSMEPTINIGDIVFVKKTEEINEQDIISFKISNTIITHRLIEVTEENGEKQYKTKGDANSGQDRETITDENIEGKYLFKIGKVGNIILFLKEPKGIAIITIIFVIYLFIINITKYSKRREKHMK